MNVRWPLSDADYGSRLSRAPNESVARVEELEIVDNHRIVRLALVGLEELPARGDEIAAEHIGIPQIVENFGSLAGQPDRHAVRTVGKVEAGEAIIAGRQPHPGRDILGRFFRGVAEVTLGQSIVPAVEMLDSQLEGFVRRIIFDVRGLLNG